MYKLSPSDFRYLWEDCKYCYYRKVKENISLPSIGIPGVFMKMNSLLQNTIVGMNMKDIHPSLPNAVVEIKEGYLKSIVIPGTKCYISGKFDVLSKTAEGDYTVIDFKITDPKEEKIQKFTAQLHAYKYAIENPVQGEAKKVSRMGLIAVSPEQIGFKNDFIFFKATPQWYEIKENMDGFMNMMGEISEFLDGELPPPTQTCDWCNYRLRFDPQREISPGDIPF